MNPYGLIPSVSLPPLPSSNFMWSLFIDLCMFTWIGPSTVARVSCQGPYPRKLTVPPHHSHQFSIVFIWMWKILNPYSIHMEMFGWLDLLPRSWACSQKSYEFTCENPVIWFAAEILYLSLLQCFCLLFQNYPWVLKVEMWLNRHPT